MGIYIGNHIKGCIVLRFEPRSYIYAVLRLVSRVVPYTGKITILAGNRETNVK